MKEFLNVKVYKDNNDTIVVFKDTNPEIECIINGFLNSVTHANVETTEIQHLEPVPTAEESPVELPSFLQDETISSTPDETISETADETKNTIFDYNTHKITMGKTYCGKTIPEIAGTEKGLGWMHWVVKKYDPNSETAHPDVKYIKKYLDENPSKTD